MNPSIIIESVLANFSHLNGSCSVSHLLYIEDHSVQTLLITITQQFILKQYLQLQLWPFTNQKASKPNLRTQSTWDQDDDQLETDTNLSFYLGTSQPIDQNDSYDESLLSEDEGTTMNITVYYPRPIQLTQSLAQTLRLQCRQLIRT